MCPTRLREIYELARKRGIQPHQYEELSDLIRAIQRAGGEVGCFASKDAANCEQYDCRWRGECMVMAQTTPLAPDKLH